MRISGGASRQRITAGQRAGAEPMLRAMRPLLAIALLAGAIGAAILLRSHDPTSPPAVGAPARSAPTPPPREADADAPAPSLRDTEVDGALVVDASGRFVPNREAIRFFDYYLSATGEETAAQIRARIEAEIARRLPPDAARAARDLLDRYLGFRAEGARVLDDDRVAASADLERRLQWVRELRRKHFGAELAETLFGEDERAVEIAIEQRRVAADPSLTPEERTARIAALEASMPESARKAREAALLPARLAEQERALRDAGGTDAEIRALREDAVGVEAADRLAALDARRAEWERRLGAYRRERDAITADASLDPAARDAALETLRARDFDARERLRVRTIDEIELGSTPP